MRAKPILFNTDMVRALLDGRKFQTRRIVKGNALEWLDDVKFDPEFVAHPENDMCPFGKKDDLLWVRETLGLRNVINHNTNKIEIWANYKASNPNECFKWNGRTDTTGIPSIHMPKWASRLTLKITDVRVERLQDISRGDCIAEGCLGLAVEYYNAILFPQHCPMPTQQFQNLWHKIIGKDSWEANPWVWAISFEVINQNVDEVLNARES